jgi:hypothetical protein
MSASTREKTLRRAPKACIHPKDLPIAERQSVPMPFMILQAEVDRNKTQPYWKMLPQSQQT